MTPQTSTPGRILLVDDGPMVRDAIRRVLEQDGHRVAVAASGLEALALLQQSTFDLVIADYEMHGMRGDTLAAAVKVIHPKRPVLMIGAYGKQLRSQGHPLSGVDALLTKPFNVEELRRAVRGLIGTAAVQPNAPEGRA